MALARVQEVHPGADGLVRVVWAEAEREKPRQSIEDGRQGTLDYIMLCVTKGFIISIVYVCIIVCVQVMNLVCAPDFRSTLFIVPCACVSLVYKPRHACV